MPRTVGNDIARFWSKVDKNGPVPAHKPELGPCWNWLGSFYAAGYAQFRARGEIKADTAHVFSYQLHKGPIPDGHDVDHLAAIAVARIPRTMKPSHTRPKIPT